LASRFNDTKNGDLVPIQLLSYFQRKNKNNVLIRQINMQINLQKRLKTSLDTCNEWFVLKKSIFQPGEIFINFGRCFAKVTGRQYISIQLKASWFGGQAAPDLK